MSQDAGRSPRNIVNPIDTIKTAEQAQEIIADLRKMTKGPGGKFLRAFLRHERAEAWEQRCVPTMPENIHDQNAALGRYLLAETLMGEGFGMIEVLVENATQIDEQIEGERKKRERINADDMGVNE